LEAWTDHKINELATTPFLTEQLLSDILLGTKQAEFWGYIIRKSKLARKGQEDQEPAISLA